MVASPLVANAQAPASVSRIGLLGDSSPTSAEARHIWQAFFRALRDLRYVEGQNVLIEGRYYGDNLDQLPALAADLVRLQVDVILAAAPPAPEAAKRAAWTIPIVMANHGDPVGSGLVASFARPGGNVTGLSMLSPDMRGKQLELLKEILPRLTRVAFLRNPDIPRPPYRAPDEVRAGDQLTDRQGARTLRPPLGARAGGSDYRMISVLPHQHPSASFRKIRILGAANHAVQRTGGSRCSPPAAERGRSPHRRSMAMTEGTTG
jgi:putative ABC transport system substrate-binding protein